MFFCFLFSIHALQVFFFLFFFLSMPCSLWDLSSLTRDQTKALGSESTVLTPDQHKGSWCWLLWILCIFWIFTSFANIFSLRWSAFLFWWLALLWKSFLVWCSSIYFHFCFLSWEDRSYPIPRPCQLLRLLSKSALPTFSSSGFMVSVLTFKPLVHFEFIFVYSLFLDSLFWSIDLCVCFCVST